jgi:hypothetical protein
MAGLLLVQVGRVVEIMRLDFSRRLRFVRAAKRSFEIQVGPEVVVDGGRRAARRTRRTALRSPRFGPFRTSRFRPSRFRPPRFPAGAFGFSALFARRALGLAGRFRRGLGGTLRFGRRRGRRLVEQEIFGGNLGIGRRLGPQVDAEEVLGQGFPGVFFAARAGAQRIGVHKG